MNPNLIFKKVEGKTKYTLSFNQKWPKLHCPVGAMKLIQCPCWDLM